MDSFKWTAWANWPSSSCHKQHMKGSYLLYKDLFTEKSHGNVYFRLFCSSHPLLFTSLFDSCCTHQHPPPPGKKNALATWSISDWSDAALTAISSGNIFRRILLIPLVLFLRLVVCMPRHIAAVPAQHLANTPYVLFFFSSPFKSLICVLRVDVRVNSSHRACLSGFALMRSQFIELGDHRVRSLFLITLLLVLLSFTYRNVQKDQVGEDYFFFFLFWKKKQNIKPSCFGFSSVELAVLCCIESRNDHNVSHSF